MTSNKVCTFCLKKGIAVPHNHTVRNWKLAGKPIICPELLATICTCCNIVGHTRQYCPSRLVNTMDVSMTDNNLKRSADNSIGVLERTAIKIQKIE
jgi:hypothetical protein